jgi:hypothetical protein
MSNSKIDYLPRNDLDDLVSLVAEVSKQLEKDETLLSYFDPAIVGSIQEVHEFIKRKRRIVYGGTALNAILSPENQFYDPLTDLPDWDFFTPTPIQDAIELADILASKGYLDVQVNPAVHHGTYKVFSSGIGVADITYLPKGLYEFLLKDEVVIHDDTHYVGPNFLRMSAYLELSRPRGDVSRWEKVMKRISLINLEYPFNVSENMKHLAKQWNSQSNSYPFASYKEFFEEMIETLNEGEESAAIMGPTAVAFIEDILLSKYKTIHKPPQLRPLPPFPLIVSSSPKLTSFRIHSLILKYAPEFTTLETSLIHSNVEFLDDYCIIEDTKTHTILGCVLGTGNGCQSVYEFRRSSKQSKKTNTGKSLESFLGGTRIQIASVETSIYLYLALRYSNEFPILGDILLASCETLLQYHYALLRGGGKGLLPPLPKECIGKQERLVDIRKERSNRIVELIRTHKTKTAEYYSRNLRYIGGNEIMRERILTALKEDGRGGGSKIFGKTRKHKIKLYGNEPIEDFLELEEMDTEIGADSSSSSSSYNNELENVILQHLPSSNRNINDKTNIQIKHNKKKTKTRKLRT